MERRSADMLPYLTRASAMRLQEDVEKNLDCYLDGQTEWGSKGWEALTSKVHRCPDLSGLGGHHSDDLADSLCLHGQLWELTPQQAADDRLWVCLCHTVGMDYVRRRWLASARRGDPKGMARLVRDHFFVSGNRGLRRDNGLSRLWWMGHIAGRINPDDPKAALESVLSTQDVRMNLLDRTSFATNTDVLRHIVERIRRSRERGDGLLERANFREWMKGINLMGGVIVLDSLDDARLGTVIEAAVPARAGVVEGHDRE